MQEARERASEPIGFFTADDIRKVKDKIQIGDSITFRRSKSYTSFQGESDIAIVHGRVIAKYPSYCILRTDIGVKESIQWIDLLLMKKRAESRDE